jgi:DNA-binding transcriptional MerR regulator
MRIGEVHSQLRKVFPEIELSKIRYYEDKGLVQPSRSRKGYRLYSQNDVECLREAIRLAQEEFVPLRVVRLRLIEQGLLKDVPVTPSSRQAAREAVANVVSIPAPQVVSVRADLHAVADIVPVGAPLGVPASVHGATIDETIEFYTIGEFLAVTGLDRTSFDHLRTLGFFAPVSRGRDILYTASDVRVATTVSSLLQRGADLRLLGSVRRIAEREVAMVDDLTAALRAKGSEVESTRAREITGEVARDVAALRAELYERAIGEYLSHET